MPAPDPFIRHHRYRIGDRLRRLRMWRNLTQEALAENVGVDRRTISRIENGHTVLDADLAHLIARALRVGPGWLFSDDPLPPPD